MSDLLKQAEVERETINSQNSGKIQHLAHQELTTKAQALVASGQFADLRQALLSLTSDDYERAYARAGLEDAQRQLADKLEQYNSE